MKKTIALVAACALLPGCLHFNWSDTHSVKGSGNVVTETRAVSGFDRVALAGSGELSVVQDNLESLTIETDDNLLPLIKSQVAGGWLRIGPEQVNLNPTRGIHYTLHLKQLRELDLSGSLGASAPSLTTDHLLIRISGSGNVHMGNLRGDDLKVEVSGSGNLNLAGKLTDQHIQISGSGSYSAGDLESQTVVIGISGSGDATVWPRQTLTAHVSGSGQVRYYGSPHVNSQVSGSGGVHSAGNK